MAEILANLSDINAHLPVNAQINNAVDSSLQVDAFRLIRGQLISIFTPTIINAWESPETTPDGIRAIAGRLIASKFYSRLFSGESSDEMPGYSINLYREAISLLTDIKSGVLILVDEDGIPLEQDDIGPNTETDVHPSDNTPVFTMDAKLS